jgi:hypothetical protein
MFPSFATSAHTSFHPFHKSQHQASTLCHRNKCKLSTFATGAIASFHHSTLHPMPQEQLQAFILRHRSNRKLSTFATGAHTKASTYLLDWIQIARITDNSDKTLIQIEQPGYKTNQPTLFFEIAHFFTHFPLANTVLQIHMSTERIEETVTCCGQNFVLLCMQFWLKVVKLSLITCVFP